MEGDAVGMVLGLSLTSEDIVWVLVDEADGTMADHDSVEFQADAEIASAAARGARSIATAGGFDVERIRLTWSDDVAREGLRLRSHLGCLGFDNVEAVPLKCAGAVLVDPDMDPALALAYGAARAEVSLLDAITVPVCTRTKPTRVRRGRIAMAVLGAAAAAVLGGALLTSGSLPHLEQTAAATGQSATTDPGWVAVSAPSDTAAAAVRKIVDTLDTETPDIETFAADTVDDAPLAEAPIAAEPLAVAPVPSALPVAAAPAPVGVPHLPEGTPHLEAPPAEAVIAAPVIAEPAPEAVPTAQPHLVDELPALGPAPEMTVPANLFTALP
jgi:hypothetical protein